MTDEATLIERLRDLLSITNATVTLGFLSRQLVAELADELDELRKQRNDASGTYGGRAVCRPAGCGGHQGPAAHRTSPSGTTRGDDAAQRRNQSPAAPSSGHGGPGMTEDELKAEILVLLRRYSAELEDFQIAGAMGEAMADWLMEEANKD
jgi:hypothetical protein